jgi:hypothetical protein
MHSPQGTRHPLPVILPEFTVLVLPATL